MPTHIEDEGCRMVFYSTRHSNENVDFLLKNLMDKAIAELGTKMDMVCNVRNDAVGMLDNVSLDIVDPGIEPQIDNLFLYLVAHSTCHGYMNRERHIVIWT